VALFTAPSVSPASAPRVSIARLPATGADLFGREEEIAWLDRCWAEGVRVASIVAWGGVGKSALVNAWLRGMDGAGWRGAERVFGWSFYSQGTDRLSSSDEFIEAALKWFGDPDPRVGSPWDKGERLAALVREQRTILVLDGVEPLQSGPGVEAGELKDAALQALVKELGAQNKGLCIITSRIVVTDLVGLGGDKVQACKLDHLSEEAGAKLLKARGADGTEEDLRAAAREYDGHSFALTLLGTYIRKAQKGDVRKRDLIPPLAGKPARRMMATYERWFQNMPEFAILRMLGLFDRPAPAEEIAVLAAEPVITGLNDALAGLSQGAWNEAVTALRDVGLLAAGSEAEDAERLDAHPLVREYFGEQLRHQNLEAWREGHERLYRHLRHTTDRYPETIEVMSRLYAAAVHGCLAGRYEEVLTEVYWARIHRKAEHFSANKLGAFSSELTVLSVFFESPWQRLVPELSRDAQAHVLAQTGAALQALGRLSESAGLTRAALTERVAQKDWSNAAASAHNLVELLQARGELSQAAAVAQQSIEFADKSGNAFLRMIARVALAAAQHALGRQGEAAALFEEAERMQKARQPHYLLLYAVQGYRYCDMLLDQGLNADVVARVAQTLEWAKVQQFLVAVALDHLSLGRAHLLAAQRTAGDDLSDVAFHINQAVDGLRRAAIQHHRPLGLLARAALYTHTRAFDLAHKDLDEALSLAPRCGFRLHEADAHLGLARLSVAEDAPAAALDHLAKARAIIDVTGYHRRDAELHALEAACSGPP
jgi:tetratricopeptide (TPR) repeat protein